MKLFSVSVNSFEERPVTSTRTFPELNWIVYIGDEKLPKYFRNGSWLYLEWIDCWIENLLCSMNRVCDDEISGKLTAWLILHLMAKSSASIEVTLIMWWIVLMIGLLWTWIYAIEVAILFLMLASEMLSMCKWFSEDMIVMN